jgi:hypothetical protein
MSATMTPISTLQKIAITMPTITIAPPTVKPPRMRGAIPLSLLASNDGGLRRTFARGLGWLAMRDAIPVSSSREAVAVRSD